jgi:hypothetical protein
MAGRANGRGSKSSSTSKGVRERIKDAREMGLSGIKSKKKDTATSGTRGKAGGARPRRTGPKGGTQITESVDNLIGGAFTKNGSKRGDLPKTRGELREKRKELIAKRKEKVQSQDENRTLRGNRRSAEKLQELREKYGGKGAGTKSSPGPKRVRLGKEEGDGTGRRTRPGGGGIKGRGPKGRPVGVDPTRGGGDNQPNRTGQKGRIGPKRGGSNRNPIGQAGGNVGPGGKGAIPIYEKGNGPKRGGNGPKRSGPGPKRNGGPKRGARPGMAMEIVTPEMFFM